MLLDFCYDGEYMKPTHTPVLQIAAKAAIISPSGKILILREAATGNNNTKVGQWGLVGGRIELGEAFMDGLKREVIEETGLQIKVDRPLYVGEWRPIIHGVSHQIVAIFILCKSTAEDVRLSNEHDEYKWIEPTKRTDFVMMEPDCFVVDEVASL